MEAILKQKFWTFFILLNLYRNDTCTDIWKENETSKKNLR